MKNVIKDGISGLKLLAFLAGFYLLLIWMFSATPGQIKACQVATGWSAEYCAHELDK